MREFGHHLTITPGAALATVAATIVLYFVFAGLLRWWGQRIYASPSSFELALVIVLGAIVGRATLGHSPTLAGALIALATLLICESAVGRIRRWAPRGARGHRGIAVLVAGQVDAATLRRYQIEDVALWAALRTAGVNSPQDVALAVLEPTGRFSVLRNGTPLDPAMLTGVRNAPDIRARLADAGLMRA